MSHSEQTLHYGLPKYIGTDIINPLTDFNDGNDAIDQALYDANTRAAHAEEVAGDAEGVVTSYDARISQAQNDANDALLLSKDVEEMMAEEFNPVKVGGYKAGRLVIHENTLYQFINDHTGAWDATDVRVATVGDAIDALISSALSGKHVAGESRQQTFNQGSAVSGIATWLAQLWTNKTSDVVDIIIDDIILKGSSYDTTLKADWSYVDTNFLNNKVSATNIGISDDGVSLIVQSIGSNYDLVNETMVWSDTNMSLTNLGTGGGMDAFALSDNGTSVTGQRYASPLSYGGNGGANFSANAVIKFHFVYAI